MKQGVEAGYVPVLAIVDYISHANFQRNGQPKITREAITIINFQPRGKAAIRVVQRTVVYGQYLSSYRVAVKSGFFLTDTQLRTEHQC